MSQASPPFPPLVLRPAEVTSTVLGGPRRRRRVAGSGAPLRSETRWNEVLTIKTTPSSRSVEHVKLRELIRDIPDFPKPGILYKDITPLLRDAAGLSLAIEYLTQPFLREGIEAVTGAESRGFIFASAVARNLSAGFVPIRKPGRLPHEVVSREYELEYGTDKLELHADAISEGDRVLLVDDLLATGGTMSACIELVRSLGGTVVGAAFLIELDSLGGRKKLGDVPIHTILHY